MAGWQGGEGGGACAVMSHARDWNAKNVDWNVPHPRLECHALGWNVSRL